MPRTEDADKLVKEAGKLINPSILSLRLKADWENAAPMFERAATIYKQAGDTHAAKMCYEKAALGQERLKSPWHAAKNMERAGELAKELKLWEDVEACYAAAAGHYNEEGRQATAAEALGRGARALEERAPDASARMYAQAVEWMEDSGKDALAGELFRQAVAQLVRMERWADAVGMLMRFAVSCDASGARSSQCKAYLGAVVVWLYAGDARAAWLSYQDSLGVDCFCSSDEAFAAEALFDAYRTADAGVVAATVKGTQTFTHLDNQIARLAKKLPQGDMAALARQLGSDGAAAAAAAAESGEEDLT